MHLLVPYTPNPRIFITLSSVLNLAMSRHRNVRNLTEDDYYDDYDDYDDDYYEDDGFDDSDYRPPLHQPVIMPTTKAKQPEQMYAEKMPMLEGMGFTPDRAKSALIEANGNFEQAVDMLLTAGVHKPLSGFTKSGITKPPPGFGAPPINLGTMPNCPPGVAAPSALELTKRGVITQPPGGFVANRALIEKDKIVKAVPKTPGVQSKKDYGPLPMLPGDLQSDLKSQKSRLAMVVLGHVDAGKSTLMGQVMVQLGYVARRAVQKYQKQATELGKASFALAWIMDEDEAERERGVTMDIATKSISTPFHDFVILDAPGHADFVPSMITGAAAADVGIVVVAATAGEFEVGFDGGGQTREHIILARGLGVSQIIVAINKLDAVDWDEQRFLEIQAAMKPFLLECGFLSKSLKFVPISGLTGANVKLRDGADKLYSWYKGLTLLEAMDKFHPAQRNIDKPLRIVVNDVYTEGNKGVSLRCRVVQGVLQVGEKVVALPVGDEALVSKIEHGSSATESHYKYAMAGDTTEINLLGIDVARLSRGSIICHPHMELRPPLERKVKARILVMERLTVPLIRGAQVLFHMHSIDVPMVLSKLLTSVHPKTKNSLKEKPRVLSAGVSATVEMTFAEKIVVEAYTECRSLGRFVLRRGGETVAIGIVEAVICS